MPIVTLKATSDGSTEYDPFPTNGIYSAGWGKDFHLPVGNTVGFLRRSFIKFGDITSANLSTTDAVPWSKVATITSAYLKLYTTKYNDGTIDSYTRLSHLTYSGTDRWNGTGSIYIDRVTSSWSEGSAGANELNSATNALEWDTMPTVSTAERATANIANTRPAQGTECSIDITSIVRGWAATNVSSGSGYTNYGIRLYNPNEGTTDRAVEFYSRDAANSSSATLSNFAPQLVITYTEVAPPVPTITIGVPDGATVSGLGTISNLTDARVWTPSTQYANTTLSWTATASVGQTISSWRLQIYSNSGLSTQVFDSGTITNSAHLSDSSYTTTSNSSKPSWLTGSGWTVGDGLLNGTQYWHKVTVVDTGGYTASASGTFKVRWGQGVYEWDTSSGFANTSGWSLDYNIPEVGTQVGAIYRVSGYQSQAQVTGMSGNGSTTTVTCANGHSFVADDVININGVAPNTYNLSNQIVLATGITATQFQVSNSLAATPAYVANTVGYATLVSYLSSAANITAVSGNGTTVTYTASNSFIAGQRVTITGCTTTAYNLSNVLIATASSTQFTVSNAATGATSSGGVATMHGRKGTNAAITGASSNGTSITYNSPTHKFVAGQSVNISGITPSAFNLSNATIASVVAGTSFTIASTVTTGTYTKGGNAESALYVNLSDVEGHNRYLHAHIRTSIDNAATTKPIISNLAFSYLSALQLPDNWSSASNTTYYLDSDNRRFGTKASKVEVTSSSDGFIYPDRGIAPSDIPVVPNTKYSFSAYVKFLTPSGANNVRLRVYPAGTTSPATATVLADSGPHTSFPADNEYWRRMSVTFTTGGATNYVRPMIYMTNSAGSLTDFFWVDGVLFEEGTVVRSWTPGFVTSGVTFEGGGLNIDTSKGGVLRLRGSSGGARDEVTVGVNGLEIGGSTNPVQVYSGSASTLNVTGSLTSSATVTGTTVSGGTLTSTGTTSSAITIPSTTAGAGLTIGTDTNLYRSAANTLKTDDALDASTSRALLGVFGGIYSGTATTVTAGSWITLNLGTRVSGTTPTPTSNSVTPGIAGVYLIAANVQIASTALNNFSIRVTAAGTNYDYYQYAPANPTAGTGQGGVSRVLMVTLTAAQSISLAINGGSGTTGTATIESLGVFLITPAFK